MTRIALSVKSKILMTVITVVVIFALFILFYYPTRQERYLLEYFNNEIETTAKTVALGVKIALTEQNFEGVETAIDFVRNNSRLQFVSLVQVDTIWDAEHKSFKIDKTIFKTFPDNIEVDTEVSSIIIGSNEYIFTKSAPFYTAMMSGEILLSFSTTEIIKSRKEIRLTSLLASSAVIIIGLLIGYGLARNISRPVLALRDAAKKVGEGDLNQEVKHRSSDEIGELSVAFNNMVNELSVEASLGRIRVEIASMRTKEDLNRITPLIWRELIAWMFLLYAVESLLWMNHSRSLNHIFQRRMVNL